MKIKLILLLLLSIVSSLNAGELTREIYKNISGHGVHLIKSHPNYPWNPDTLDTISQFEFGPKTGDNYGARVLGYITIPEDGAYTFFISSDDQGELNISLDGTVANLQKIASASNWTAFRSWTKYASQKSAVFNLTAGQVIYTEAFVKEGSGGDHLSVAWSKDGGPIEVISGDHLSPFTYNFTEQQELLTNAIQVAQSLYEQSAANVGTEAGEYSEASRLNFLQDINGAKATLDTEASSGRVLAKAIDDLDKATAQFTGGIKPTKILGVPFGSSPAWSSGSTFEKSHDGDLNTYFDYLLNNGGFTGIEIPDGRETAVLALRYHPRNGQYKRMVGGMFQGSVDGVSYTTIHKITELPTYQWHTVSISDTTVYKYLRYLGPDNSHCNIAELEFLGLQNQELFMLNHEVVSLKAGTAFQAITKKSIQAEHGGLLPQFISYKLLELPENGVLKLKGNDLTLDSIFTQEDINNGDLSFSSGSSRKNTSFKVAVTSTVGGTIPEVIIDIKIDSDFDGLSDEQEIALGTDFDDEDTNNNGLTDSWEVENGLDPVADTLSPMIESIEGENGLSASYFYGRFASTADFAGKAPMKVTKVSGINFGNSYWGEFANSGKVHNVGAKFSGYIYIPIAGNYRFILSSDDGSKLFIDGIQLISNDGLHSYKQVEGVINLSAGFHKIRCDYFEAGGNHGCILQWEGPSRVRQVIPSSFFFLSIPEHKALEDSIDTDQDFLTDKLEALEGTDPNNPDTDGDKILDGEEYHAAYDYKTNPLNVDTDGDTVSDFDEIFIYQSNPLIADFSGEETLAYSIDPSQFTASKGIWGTATGSVFSNSVRGELTYEIDLEKGGNFVLRMGITQNEIKSDKNIHPIQVFVGKEYVDHKFIKASYGEEKSVDFILPNLRPGKSSITIRYDNVFRYNSLKINSLDLYIIHGLKNGQSWLESHLSKLCNIKNRITKSKTSPVCIEGNGKYLSMMQINKGLSEVKRGTLNHWYANVQLQKGQESSIPVSWQNGARKDELKIEWVETNLCDENSISIRKGDSLLLNILKATTQDLGAYAALKINEDYHIVGPGNPLEYKFNEAGEVEIKGYYIFNGVEENFYLTVNVVEAPEQGPFHLWRFKERSFTWDNLPSECVLDGKGMALFKNNQDGTYQLRRDGYHDDFGIVARLGENGPVISSIKTPSFYIYELVEGYTFKGEVYPDGSWRIQDTVFINHNFPEDVDIQMQVFVSGVTTLDGNTVQWLKKSDFDELGQYEFNLIKAADRLGAACHRIKAWYKGSYIGSRR